MVVVSGRTGWGAGQGGRGGERGGTELPLSAKPVSALLLI